MTERKTFSDAFTLLLKIQSSQAKNTLAQTKCVLAHLQPWFAENAPYLDDFEKDYEETWAMYRAACAGKITRKGKPRRLAHDRRYLVTALKRAHNKGWTKRAFTKKDFLLNEVHEPIGRALSDDEVRRLLQALSDQPKTKTQVLMALTMGMRLGEILKLRVDEVDVGKRVLNLDAARIKTRRPRRVPIPISNQVLEDLLARVNAAQGKFVFPMDRNPNEAQSDNRHWWSMARRDSGVNCRFHDLRHTWATNMVARGTPQDYIVKVGGFHPDIMSRVYSHMQEDSMEEFRKAFDGRFENKTETKPTNSTGEWRYRLRQELQRVLVRLAA